MRSVRFIATLCLLFLSQQSISSTNNAGIVLCSAERPPPPKEAPPDPPQENDQQQQLSSSSTRTTSLLSTVTTACGAGIVGGSLGQLMRHRLDMKLKVTIALGTTCFLVSLFSDLLSFGHNNNSNSPEHHQYQQPTLQKVHSDELSYDSDRIGGGSSTEEGEANWWPGMKATNLKDDDPSSSQHNNNNKKQRQSTKQYSTNQNADIRVDYKAPPKPKEEKKPFVNPLLFWKRAKVEPEPEPKNKPPAWTNVDKDLGYVEDW